MDNRTADVIVVGAGNAALTAALAAREQGCDVLVVEAAPRELRGGNSRFSGGIFPNPAYQTSKGAVVNMTRAPMGVVSVSDGRPEPCWWPAMK